MCYCPEWYFTVLSHILLSFVIFYCPGWCLTALGVGWSFSGQNWAATDSTKSKNAKNKNKPKILFENWNQIQILAMVWWSDTEPQLIPPASFFSPPPLYHCCTTLNGALKTITFVIFSKPVGAWRHLTVLVKNWPKPYKRGKSTENIARGTKDQGIDSVTWTKFGNNMAPLALVVISTTRWHHSH